MNRRELIRGIGMGVLTGAPVLACTALPKPTPPEPTHITPGREAAPGRPEIERLLDAIAQVESGGDPKAIGDNGRAVGMYQIWRVYVDDCNRIIRRVSDVRGGWTYADRLDPVASRDMCRLYIQYYGHYPACHDGYHLERMARIWNGGPKGHTKKATLKYWAKVRKAMQP